MELRGGERSVRSSFATTIRVLEGLSSPRSVDIYDIACNQSLLSRVACAAGSGLTPATGQAEADKAIESLRRAIAAGWDRPDHMRLDTDLDPLAEDRLPAPPD